MAEKPPESEFYKRLKPHIANSVHEPIIRQAYRHWVVDKMIRKRLKSEIPGEELPEAFHPEDQTLPRRALHRYMDMREEYLRRGYFYGPPPSYIEASTDIDDLFKALDHDMKMQRADIDLMIRGRFPGETEKATAFHVRRIKSPNMEQVVEAKAFLQGIRRRLE